MSKLFINKAISLCLILGFTVAGLSAGDASAQGRGAAPKERESSDPFRWRNIGPANMVGRISAIDAYDKDYRTVVIGTASGGVYYSENAGITFRSIFDKYGSQSIGDVAMFQGDPKIVWVGTGEATNRNSVGWGDGIYKSSDAGKTFTHMGLKETNQISEIATHPTDPNIVYAAAIGSLWGPSGERGLYKTTDGGKTWTPLTNGIPANVGATVVAMHPTNPDILFVGLYERHRSAFHMESGGPNGGLFKSIDAGASWTKITNGLPTGNSGQIDIDFYAKNPDILALYFEASDELPDDLSVPGPGVYRSVDGGETWKYQLRHNSRPYYHGRIRINPEDDNKIYVVSRAFFNSIDGGKTFKRGAPWNRSGGGDDHDLWIAPTDGDVYYTATDQGAYFTTDAGKAWLKYSNIAAGQYYAIGVDHAEPFNVYGGLQDNGGFSVPSNSRDRAGILEMHAKELNGGDGFHMQIDPTDASTVYTTAHVGTFGRMNVDTRDHTFITPTPATISNFGDYYDPNFDESPTNYSINGEERWIWRDIENRTINGAGLPPQFRWNWNSPLVMSQTNPDTIYVGSSYLFKSQDQGDTWLIISPDLTKNDSKTRNSTYSGGLTKDATGAENHNTIYTVDESALNAAIIWTGSDDGLVHVTKDGGASWENVTANMPGLPDGSWVTRVEASHHDQATAYVAVDRHWWDDFKPYIYRTTDFGKTFTKITLGIPDATPGNSVYTIVEDHVNPNLLFAGTEFGVYMSADAGASWSRFMNNLPPVAVHDLVIHPRDNALVAGTHGRSIWIVDDLSPLQAGTDGKAKLKLFKPAIATKWLALNNGRRQNFFKFIGENPTFGAAINYSLAKDQKAVEVSVEDLTTGISQSWKEKGHKGVNRTHWNFQIEPSKAAKEAHRKALSGMLKVIDARLKAASTTREIAMVKEMYKDLLAVQRYPRLYDNEKYKHTSNPELKPVLQEHLNFVAKALRKAKSVRDFFNVREHLLAYSQLVGDQAYMGFYGKELRMIKAKAGSYRVTVKAAGKSASDILAVREDPARTGH
jgi:photosystem II stability/assembly factor-like uncharacterized protein